MLNRDWRYEANIQSEYIVVYIRINDVLAAFLRWLNGSAMHALDIGEDECSGDEIFAGYAKSA